MTKRLFLAIVVMVSVVFCHPEASFGLEDAASAITKKEVGFSTVLGAKIDTALMFTDESGNQVQLGALLKEGVPTILVPLYFGCPRLCGLLLNGFLDLVRELKLTMGPEYNVITLSFDPTEGAELARDKSQNVFRDLNRPDVNGQNWHFLVGNEGNIRALMDQIGFNYKKDGEEFAHASGFIVLTPQGEISQYFTGILFPAWDVRLALIEASKGAIGSAIDHILLFCYRFDPAQGKYTLIAFNVLRSGVLAAVLLFAAAAFWFSRKVKRT